MLSPSELALLGRSPLALKVLATIAATRCSPFEALDRVIPSGGYREVRDIPYGALLRQQLDIYRPATDDPAPVVLFLYGGGWREGERRGYRFIGESFASRGCVAVIADYRLFPGVRFPSFIEDAAGALAWTHRNIGAHGGDPDRIFVAGHSAGAHTAALLALDPRFAAAAGVSDGTIKGLIGLAGPYAFEPLAYDWTRPVFESAAKPDDARPIAQVRPGAPPMLLLHGARDETVWPVNSEQLTTRLGEVGSHARLIAYPKLGHVTILLALATPFRKLAPVQDDVLAFLRETISTIPTVHAG